MDENVINLDERLASLSSNEEKQPINLGGDEPTETVTDNEEDTDDSSEVSTQTDESGEDIIDENSDEGSTQAAEGFTPAADSQEDEILDGDIPSTQPNEPASEYKFKDDYIKKAVEYYETYGTLTPFLEATSVNYDEVSDEAILKMAFDKENADLPDKVRAKLFEKSLEKYNLDSYEEDEIELGRAVLKRDANKLRNEYKKSQEEFIQSIQPSQVQEVSQEEIAAQQAEARKNIQQNISKAVKDNMIRLEANGEGINYQLPSVDNVVEYAVDPNKFLSSFAKDGNVDWQKWTMAVAFVENPTTFINELIKHGKSLGRKAMETELKNSAPLSSTKDVIETNDFVNPTDNPVEFLRGMKVRK